MIAFTNTKVNLGLNVVEKRKDGYHNIETIFYPVGWCDVLEVISDADTGEEFNLTFSGVPVPGDVRSNLITQTWMALKTIRNLPPLKVHLHKNTPMGAGLGGGSANAAGFLKLVNSLCSLDLNDAEQYQILSEIGSDCAFFMHNKPVLATGKGDVFSAIPADLSKYYILIVYPDVPSGTAEAYASLRPAKPKHRIQDIILQPVSAWRAQLVNDFEPTIFKKYPQIGELKNELYKAGALYASMSGSGSSVFGIFDQLPEISLPPQYRSFLQNPLLTLAH